MTTESLNVIIVCSQRFEFSATSSQEMWTAFEDCQPWLDIEWLKLIFFAAGIRPCTSHSQNTLWFSLPTYELWIMKAFRIGQQSGRSSFFDGGENFLSHCSHTTPILRIHTFIITSNVESFCGIFFVCVLVKRYAFLSFWQTALSRHGLWLKSLLISHSCCHEHYFALCKYKKRVNICVWNPTFIRWCAVSFVSLMSATASTLSSLK